MRAWLLFRLACPLVVFASCAASSGKPELAFHGGVSALPNVGLTLGGEQVFREMSPDGAEWAVTLDGTLQPWDEELFHDDGNPAAGTWSQVQLGLRRTTLSEEGRRWSWRGGFMWARAGIFPNLVQQEGDYNGAYCSYGFASSFAEGWWLGPEISLILVEHEGSISELGFFPQIVWRAERRF